MQLQAEFVKNDSALYKDAYTTHHTFRYRQRSGWQQDVSVVSIHIWYVYLMSWALTSWTCYIAALLLSHFPEYRNVFGWTNYIIFNSNRFCYENVIYIIYITINENIITLLLKI